MHLWFIRSRALCFWCGQIHYVGKWEVVGPWKSRVFWALWNGIEPILRVPFWAQNTREGLTENSTILPRRFAFANSPLPLASTFFQWDESIRAQYEGGGKGCDFRVFVDFFVLVQREAVLVNFKGELGIDSASLCSRQAGTTTLSLLGS